MLNRIYIDPIYQHRAKKMEETESEQLIQFIRSSHERIKEAFCYIEGDNVPAAAYCLGQLDTLHATLLDVYEDDKERESCCPVDEILKDIKAICGK